MSSSRIIATSKRSVFMAHICSECGFPVISVVQIEAEAQKTYTFSREKAEQIASETANNAIEEEIARIEGCKKEKRILVGKLNKDSMIALGHFCDSSFTGHQTHCPNCWNLEPWKGQYAGQKTIGEIEDQCFPIIFKEADAAEKWAFEYVCNMVDDIYNLRASASNIENNIITAVEYHHKQKQLQKQLDDIPEKKYLAQQKEQLTIFQTQKEKLGILDLKKKKELNTNIKVAELKISDLNKAVSEKSAPIQSQLERVKQTLILAQAIAFGCDRNIITLRNGNAFAYKYKPLEIPSHLIEDIKENKQGATQADFCKNQQNSSAPSDVPMFCRKCGYKLISGSAFCSKCGTKIQ